MPTIDELIDLYLEKNTELTKQFDYLIINPKYINLKNARLKYLMIRDFELNYLYYYVYRYDPIPTKQIFESIADKLLKDLFDTEWSDQNLYSKIFSNPKTSHLILKYINALKYLLINYESEEKYALELLDEYYTINAFNIYSSKSPDLHEKKSYTQTLNIFNRIKALSYYDRVVYIIFARTFEAVIFNRELYNLISSNKMTLSKGEEFLKRSSETPQKYINKFSQNFLSIPSSCKTLSNFEYDSSISTDINKTIFYEAQVLEILKPIQGNKFNYKVYKSKHFQYLPDYKIRNIRDKSHDKMFYMDSFSYGFYIDKFLTKFETLNKKLDKKTLSKLFWPLAHIDKDIEKILKKSCIKDDIYKIDDYPSLRPTDHYRFLFILSTIVDSEAKYKYMDDFYNTNFSNCHRYTLGDWCVNKGFTKEYKVY